LLYNSMETSEFGSGCFYCLALFAKHAERSRSMEYWFDGARDHLFDLEIPTTISPDLQGKIRDFRDWVLDAPRFPEHFSPSEEGERRIQELKSRALLELQDIFLALDRELGLSPIPAQWD
jgi:hypothetical protein